jgi:hypothetical protein
MTTIYANPIMYEVVYEQHKRHFRANADDYAECDKAQTFARGALMGYRMLAEATEIRRRILPTKAEKATQEANAGASLRPSETALRIAESEECQRLAELYRIAMNAAASHPAIIERSRRK